MFGLMRLTSFVIAVSLSFTLSVDAQDSAISSRRELTNAKTPERSYWMQNTRRLSPSYLRINSNWRTFFYRKILAGSTCRFTNARKWRGSQMPEMWCRMIPTYPVF